MRTVARALVGLLAVVGAIALAVAVGFAARGASARSAPAAWEARLARQALHLAIPRAARDATNPVPAGPEALADARAHWADHCASCHGNDGKGDTQLGRNLYPRAPDMTATATQDLSDGELYWIIENGVRLTGMPAWVEESEEHGEEGSWELVHFIRHLPEITPEEVREMARFNPISRAELEEEMAAEEFLEGPEQEPEHTHQHEH